MTALGTFTSAEWADDVEQFFKSHKAPAAERAVKQTIEKIRSNAAWLARDEAPIRDYFTQIGM